MTEPEANHPEEDRLQRDASPAENAAAKAGEEFDEVQVDSQPSPGSGLPDPAELYPQPGRGRLPVWLMAVLGVLVLLGAGFGVLRLLERSAIQQAAAGLAGGEYAAAEAAAGRALGLPFKALQAEHARAYLLRGQARLHQGRLDEALDDLLTATQAYPTDAVLQNGLAQIYLARGELDKAYQAGGVARTADDSLALPYALDALKSYNAYDWGEALTAADAALQRGDDSGLALRIRAALELWTEDFIAAEADLDTAAEQAPNDIEIRALQVYLYTELGKQEQASAALETVKAISTDSAVSLWAQGWVANDQSHYEEARTLAGQALELEKRPEFYLLHAFAISSESPEAKKQFDDDLTQALALNPDFFPALLVQTIHLMASYQLPEFEPVVQRLEQMAPESYSTQMLRCQYNTLYYYLDDALDSCQAAVERAPDLAEPLAMTGWVHAMRNEYDLAWEKTEAALAFAPQDMYVLSLAYAISMRQDDREKALSFVEEMLKSHDGEARAHAFKAQLYNDDKEYRLANTELEKALQIDPYSSDAIDARIQMSMSSDDTLTALNDANDQITANPKNPEYYLSRGWIYLYDENLDKAKQDANTAISLNKRSAEGYLLLASIYSAQADDTAAIMYAEKSIELYPFVSNPYALMALAYCNMASEEKCIANSEKAAELAPWDESATLMLASVYHNTGKIEESLALLEKLVEKKDDLDVDTLDKVENLYTFMKSVAPAVDGKRTQVDTKHQFSVTYPTTWIPQPPENSPFDDGSVFWDIVNEDSSGKSNFIEMYLFVYDFEGASQYPAAAYAYAFRQEYAAAFENYQFFNSKTFRAAGITGAAEECQFEDTYGEKGEYSLKFRIKQYYFVQGDTVYMFWYITDPDSYDDYLTQADEIVATFTIPE